MHPNHKRIRLHPVCYAYPGNPCSITLSIKDKKEVFGYKYDLFTREALGIVRAVAKKGILPLHRALFMPDHVHLCIEASPSMSIIDFIKEIKSRIAVMAPRYSQTSSFWQASFFDHFLRKEENLFVVIRYILNNPCRKNMVSQWCEYPYQYSNQYTDEELRGEF